MDHRVAVIIKLTWSVELFYLAKWCHRYIPSFPHFLLSPSFFHEQVLYTLSIIFTNISFFSFGEPVIIKRRIDIHSLSLSLKNTIHFLLFVSLFISKYRLKNKTQLSKRAYWCHNPLHLNIRCDMLQFVVCSQEANTHIHTSVHVALKSCTKFNYRDLSYPKRGAPGNTVTTLLV